MTGRRWTTQADILSAVVRRLRESIDFYNDANCFLLDQPIPAEFPSGKEGCTVSPGSGNFHDPAFAGAGADTVVEDATFVVTPFVRHVSDRPRRDTVKMIRQPDGLLERKWLILRALLADDYDLVDQNGRPLLREQLAPRSAGAPGEVQVGKYRMIGLELTFSAPFDWALPPIDFDYRKWLEANA